MQVFVALQHPLHAASRIVVILADDAGIENAGSRGERVHRGEDRFFENGAVERNRRVEVREGRDRSRVGVIVGGNVDGLHGGDRTALGRGDAFLQFAHFRGEGWLVTDGARHATEQCGYFRSAHDKAEDVVNEEQHVAAFVAEIFRHRQAAQADPQAHSGRLVHLAKDHNGLVNDARFLHFEVQVVALARALADAAEHGIAAVFGRDGANQFLDDGRLAHARAAEHADLAAFDERRDEVNDLHAGFEEFRRGDLFFKRRGRAMNRIKGLGIHRTLLVNRFADDVEDASQCRRPDGYRDGLTRVNRDHTAAQSIARIHRDGADPVIAELLLNLKDQVVVTAAALNFQGVINLG